MSSLCQHILYPNINVTGPNQSPEQWGTATKRFLLLQFLITWLRVHAESFQSALYIYSTSSFNLKDMDIKKETISVNVEKRNYCH